MIIRVKRFAHLNDSTVGALYIGNQFFGFTLEDEHRDVKIAGETRIPAGVYSLGIRKAESKLTKKYRDRFPGLFEYHIHIKDVPGFQYIYMHIGNTDDHSEGCILIGSTAHSEGTISRSSDAFREFYKKVYPEIKEKEGIILIEDI